MTEWEKFDNIVLSLSNKDKSKIIASYQKYCIFDMSIFDRTKNNSIHLTDNYNKYKDISDDGDYIVETEDVVTILNFYKDFI